VKETLALTQVHGLSKPCFDNISENTGPAKYHHKFYIICRCITVFNSKFYNRL